MLSGLLSTVDDKAPPIKIISRLFQNNFRSRVDKKYLKKIFSINQQRISKIEFPKPPTTEQEATRGKNELPVKKETFI